MTWRPTSILATLAILLGAVGCIRPAGPGDLKRELSADAGVHLNREVGITVTRSGIWLARQIMKMGDEPLPKLKGLRRVEIGVYRVESLRRGADEARAIPEARFAGWHPLVQIKEDGDDVRVLTQEKNGQIRKMLVVVASEDEWVLIRLSGRLDRVIESSLAFAFDEMDRPELFEKTREAIEQTDEYEADEDGEESYGEHWSVEAVDRTLH